MKEVGKVTHYYNKIGVAIIELSGALKAGDRIKFGEDEAGLEQAVDSMQVEHESIAEAKKGDVIGVKVGSKVHEGAKVFKMEE